jgi:hypothetical protein
MDAKPRSPEETYGPALRKAQQEFPNIEPAKIAACAAVPYEKTSDNSGFFEIPFFGTLYHVYWPQGTVVKAADRTEADIATHIILLHYLLTADGTPLASQWIAFRNLPGGLGYDAAFRGRASLRLAHAFGNDQAAFEKASQVLRGEPLTFGDASYLYRILPRVWMAVVLNVADEEFSANANVLFDAATSHYLPTEDIAVLGGMLAGRLIKAARSG